MLQKNHSNAFSCNATSRIPNSQKDSYSAGIDPYLDRLALRRMNSLRIKFERDGLFETSFTRLVVEPLICLTTFLCTFIFFHDMPAVSVCFQTLACIHIVWWIHDAGHQAYFSSEEFSRFVCEALGQLFLGMPQIEYHFTIHRKHHRETNDVHSDPALQTGPVTWHSLQRVNESELMRLIRPVLWLSVVLPLTWPIMTAQCVWLLVKQKCVLRLSLTVLRWTFFIALFQDKLPLLTIPPLIAGFILGLSASLNHFHMPIWTSRVTWLQRVFYSTQNISPANRFLGWIMGGLNCHVEHHLFPNMPSHHLAQAALEVKEFAKEFGLPYHAHGFGKSIRLLFRKLRENEPMSKSGVRAS